MSDARRQEPERDIREDIEDLLRRVDALPQLDARLPDEILGYDAHGLPG